jgi:hypothetical protein
MKGVRSEDYFATAYSFCELAETNFISFKYSRDFRKCDLDEFLIKNGFALVSTVPMDEMFRSSDVMKSLRLSPWTAIADYANISCPKPTWLVHYWMKNSDDFVRLMLAAA